ncbi:MAG: hypothetical protein JWL89_583 [Candidatus Saccharibacteria bacterium]|nr:hypothetical protein [Candidatus Saccharibacteria bacterium]
MNNHRLITGLKVLTPLLILLFIFVWIASHGFIDVTVENGSGKNLTYKVLNQGGDTVATIESADSHIKKIASKGTAQITVDGDSKSYFKITHTKGFLGVTKVVASLQSEKSRQFVGNNPHFCMHYGQDILYSYDCSEPGGLTAHLPATASTPTTTFTEKEPPYIPLIGFIDAGGTNKVLATDDEENSVSVYDIDPDLRLTNAARLAEASASDSQNVLSYKSGFIIYNHGLSKIAYYESPVSSPVSIKTISPDEKTKNPVGLSVYGDGIGALFNDGSDVGDIGLEGNQTTGTIAGSSQFITYTQDSAKSYTLNKLYTSGGLCGDTKLCLINSNVLDVYDIGSGEAKYVFSMKDVQRVLPVNGKAVIATNSKVMVLDQESLSGSTQFSYGSGQYCGISQSANGYVLCQITTKDNNVALYINTSQQNTDSIDKKIYGLLQSPDVSDVSAYKNFIYISPNLGQPIYNLSSGEYEYDPAIKASTNKNINQLIGRLGINTSRYTVINPLGN